MKIDFVQATDDPAMHMCMACGWKGTPSLPGRCKNPKCQVSGCVAPVRSREQWCVPPDDGSLAETSPEVWAGAGRPATGHSGDSTHQDDYDIEMCIMMVEQLGGHARSYKRERASAFRRIVSEVYSPPRVTSMLDGLRKQGLAPGFALDITCYDDDGSPWDLALPEKQEKAMYYELSDPFSSSGPHAAGHGALGKP